MFMKKCFPDDMRHIAFCIFDNMRHIESCIFDEVGKKI